jgi:hypothetical protein
MYWYVQYARHQSSCTSCCINRCKRNITSQPSRSHSTTFRSIASIFNVLHFLLLWRWINFISPKRRLYHNHYHNHVICQQQVHGLFQSESSASFFNFQHLLIFLSSSGICLRLLPRLPVPSIFPSVTCVPQYITLRIPIGFNPHRQRWQNYRCTTLQYLHSGIYRKLQKRQKQSTSSGSPSSHLTGQKPFSEFYITELFIDVFINAHSPIVTILSLHPHLSLR